MGDVAASGDRESAGGAVVQDDSYVQPKQSVDVDSGDDDSMGRVEDPHTPLGEKGAEVMEEEEPLHPLPPEVSKPECQFYDVGTSFATVAWTECRLEIPAVPATEPERVQLYQQQLHYKIERYDMQLQQVPVDIRGLGADQALQRAHDGVSSTAWVTVYSAGGREAQLQALQPGRFYAVRIAALAEVVVQDGSHPPIFYEGPASDVLIFRTLPTPPGPMQPPALTQRARNALKLKWGTPEETGGEPITEFRLEVTPQPGGTEGPQNEDGFWEVYRGDEQSHRLTRLAPGVRYTFRILACNTLGPSRWSLCSSFSTQASVPSPPEPPIQVGASQDSVSLEWGAPPDNGDPITSYLLEVDDGAGGDFHRPLVRHECNAVVDRLRPGMRYRVRLRAENGEGRSTWSAPAEVTTTAGLPSSPQCPTASVTHTSAVLSWSMPAEDGGSPILDFQVQLQAKSRHAMEELGRDWVIIHDGPGTTTTCGTLQPGCSYLVRISARTKAGSSPYSAPLPIKTLPGVPAQPAPPTAEATPSNTMLLRWTPPRHDGGAPITGYQVETRCSPEDAANMHLQEAVASSDKLSSLALSPCFTLAYSGLGDCVVLNDLFPGVTYNMRLRVTNEVGPSPWSDISSVTTPPAAPLPPAAPIGGSVTSSSVSLSWRAPYSMGAPVTSYTVSMARLVLVQEASSSSSSGSENGEPGLASDNAASGSDAGGLDAAPPPAVRWEPVYSGSVTGCMVRNLDAASNYAFRVRAHNCRGGSAWSAETEVTTAPAPPAAPSSPEVAAVGSAQLRLRWQAPGRDNGASVVAYLAEAAPQTKGGGGGSAAWFKVYSGPELECVVQGLAAGRSYQARVRAANSQGWSPWSEVGVGGTDAAPPGPPPRPSFSQRTAVSVKVRWGLPDDTNGAPVTEYVLQAQLRSGSDEGGGGGEWVEVYRGPDLTTRCGRLQPGSVYRFRVAAGNRAGQGPWGDEEEAATALRPPPPPVGVDAQLRELPGGEWTAVVAWRAPDIAGGEACAEVVSYEVEAAPAVGAAGSGLLRQTAARTSVSVNLQGLQPGASYTLRMRSVGAAGAGHSRWSEPAVVLQVPAAAAVQGDAGGGALVALGGEAGEGAVAAKRRNKRRGGAASSRAEAAAVAEDSGGGEELRGGARRGGSFAGEAKARKRPATRWQRFVAQVLSLVPKKVRQQWKYMLVVLLLAILLWWVFSMAKAQAAGAVQARPPYL